MTISSDLKAKQHRDRLIEKAKEYQVGTYSRRFVAPLFQKMVRAESGADPRKFVTAVVDGTIRQVARKLGECVCVTCGKVLAWDSGQLGMHTGHFVASRCNSIVYEETNTACQCCSCNIFKHGNPGPFRTWMEAVRGLPEIERLERLKADSRQFTRDELVDMRIGFGIRLKAAIERMAK